MVPRKDKHPLKKVNKMRIKITLKSSENLKIPYNYNYALSSLIYNTIADLDLAKELHSSDSFKFFTFSQIHVKQPKFNKNEIIAKNGIFSFYLSSPCDKLINSLTRGFLEKELVFLNKRLNTLNVELIKTPIFNDKERFNTISPIIIRSKREVDGKLRIWDLPPSDEFFKKIENNLVKKYCIFNKIKQTPKEIKACSEMTNVKRKRITINKGSTTTYHRAYLMDLILKGDSELINFAYDVGLGEKNSMGFGMINLE